MRTSPTLLFYAHHFCVRLVDIYYLQFWPRWMGEKGWGVHIMSPETKVKVYINKVPNLQPAR